MATQQDTVARRGFLKSAAATTSAGLLAMNARSALGAEANSKLEIGIVGCGGRGAWLGGLFQEFTNTKVVALHDYFEKRVRVGGKRLDVPESRQYIGLDGYKELIDSKLDAVAIISPPYFHPEQAVAVLDAGKHLYLAKPIAVDVPGCMTIVNAAKKAEGKLTTLVDFQTRNQPLYQEAARRVHAGAIGKPVCGQAYYDASRLGLKGKPDGSDVSRLKNWVFDIPLSGDIIVEQNIHVIDVANWLLQGHPVKAQGAGGRKARVDVGDTWDHYAVTYWYPDDVLLDFSSTQFTYAFDDLCTRIYCDLGTVDTHYGGNVWVKGKSESWPGGETTQIYREGAVNNMKDFHRCITENTPMNNAQSGADSTLASILGRIAARQEGVTTWDEMMKANERVDAQLKLPKDGPYA